MLILSGLNAWVFHSGVYARVVEWDLDAVPPGLTRLAGVREEDADIPIGATGEKRVRRLRAGDREAVRDQRAYSETALGDQR